MEQGSGTDEIKIANNLKSIIEIYLRYEQNPFVKNYNETINKILLLEKEDMLLMLDLQVKIIKEIFEKYRVKILIGDLDWIQEDNVKILYKDKQYISLGRAFTLIDDPDDIDVFKAHLYVMFQLVATKPVEKTSIGKIIDDLTKEDDAPPNLISVASSSQPRLTGKQDDPMDFMAALMPMLGNLLPVVTGIAERIKNNPNTHGSDPSKIVAMISEEVFSNKEISEITGINMKDGLNQRENAP